ncbi:hypothetical protein KJ855_04005 [Patescibacteria group bacterium]|nr:hypothetical protein [Patescibacteria group bacterium]
MNEFDFNDFNDFNDFGGSGFDSGDLGSMDYSSNYGLGSGLPELFAGFGLLGLVVGIIVGLVVLVLTIYLLSRYFRKMGYSPWLSLLLLLNIVPILGPLVMLVLYIYFAVVEWPVEKELKKFKGGGESKMEEKKSE